MINLMYKNPVQFETLENGDLKIVVTKDYRRALEDMVTWFDDSVTFYVQGYLIEKLIEQYSEYNYEYFESNDALLTREGISMGLTSAPVIVQRAPVDDALKDYEIGEFDELSKFWAFEPYAIRSEIADIVRNGEVTFMYLGTYAEMLEEEKGDEEA